MLVGGATALGLVLLALASLTTMGSRKRGSGIPLAFIAGVCFPITWAVWYVRDQHPYQRALS